MRVSLHREGTNLLASVRLVTCFSLAVSVILGSIGCSGYSALSSGSQAPTIVADGWTNGGPPSDLDGSVIVLEMFATW